MHKKILETITQEEENQIKNHLKRSRLDPYEYFQTENTYTQEMTRSLLKGYLRFFHQNESIVSPPDPYLKIDVSVNKIPVLHFEDGEKNHYLLKRISDEIFDLIKLEYSPSYHQYSGKTIENYSLENFIELASISGNDLIRMAIYEENSFKPPVLMNREIQIQSVSMVNILEDRKRKEKEAILKAEEIKRIETLKQLSALARAEVQIREYNGLLEKIRKEERKRLQEKKDLVLMRLPHMKEKLSDTNNEREINIAVQNEIIRKVFIPDPKEENCPGKIEGEHCFANGNWDEKTWTLYRKLYRFTNIAGELFHEFKPWYQH